MFNLMSLFHKPSIPDDKLPIGDNEYLGPVKSNVNYNYKPVQTIKMQKQLEGHETDNMQYYIPKENGGI